MYRRPTFCPPILLTMLFEKMKTFFLKNTFFIKICNLIFCRKTSQLKWKTISGNYITRCAFHSKIATFTDFENFFPKNPTFERFEKSFQNNANYKTPIFHTILCRFKIFVSFLCVKRFKNPTSLASFSWKFSFPVEMFFGP